MEDRGIRLVVADDDDRFLDVLCAFLAAQPRAEVVARASNGAQAVEAALRTRPDIVLLDLDMPVLDGVGAARQIRSDGSAGCVVLVSGSNEDAVVVAAREAGVAAYVPKSRVFTELMPAIELTCLA